MAFTKTLGVLCVLMTLLACAMGAEEEEAVFVWSEVAAFLAGAFAVMILLIGTGFFLNEMVCRQYFNEPAAEYYAVRGDLPNIRNENTRL